MEREPGTGDAAVLFGCIEKFEYAERAEPVQTSLTEVVKEVVIDMICV
jgi:hypothetical protein